MKNSVAKSSTFLPLPRSTRLQTLGKKSELVRDGKIDSIESLPRMVDKLCIDENAKRRTTDKSVQKVAIENEVTEPVRNLKKATIALYNVDEMSPQELQASLRRIEKNPQEPFSFLANISRIFTDEDQLSKEARKPSEIDVQLAAVAKRIESSRALLEEAKSRAKEIQLRVKRNSVNHQSSDAPANTDTTGDNN